MSKKRLTPWGFIGMGGMACVLFLLFGTADVAPWWVTALLVLLWLLLMPFGFIWFERRPTWVPWLPVVVFAAWLPTIWFGTRLLGWGTP